MFHIAAIVDVKECVLDFLDCTDSEMEEYKEVLRNAFVREAVELERSLRCHANELKAWIIGRMPMNESI